MNDDVIEQAADAFRRAYEAQMGGRLQDAAELYRESIRLHPTAEAHTFLGWTYSFMGRVDDAIAECKRAIRADPDFGNPYNDIGAYLIGLGRFDEAVPWLEKAKAAPRYEPRHFPHYNLARVHIFRGDIGPAIRELEEAVSLEPGYTLARRELARLRARMN